MKRSITSGVGAPYGASGCGFIGITFTFEGIPRNRIGPGARASPRSRSRPRAACTRRRPAGGGETSGSARERAEQDAQRKAAIQRHQLVAHARRSSRGARPRGSPGSACEQHRRSSARRRPSRPSPCAARSRRPWGRSGAAPPRARPGRFRSGSPIPMKTTFVSARPSGRSAAHPSTPGRRSPRCAGCA